MFGQRHEKNERNYLDRTLVLFGMLAQSPREETNFTELCSRSSVTDDAQFFAHRQCNKKRANLRFVGNTDTARK